MRSLITFAFLAISFCVFPNHKEEKDTLYTEIRQDIVVLSSTKETNSLKSLPAAVSVFSPKNLDGMQIASLKDLSAITPNFFSPNYGSKMTSPVYIRGLGARTGTQTVSMYVDNIPYFNPSVFDFELHDIQRVEILRGTQGTLYGRNSMGGIMNVYTYSPLSYEGTKATISGGNHGYLASSVSHYRRLNSKIGVSVAGYYKRDDGFFENAYTGKKVDDSENAGGRFKFRWEPTYNLSIQYSGGFEYTTQGAFPYMSINDTKVNYDGPGSYERKVNTNGLSIQYNHSDFVVNSITGYQYLNDDMHMDQDYTPAKIFNIRQRQNQHSVSQEFTIKSNRPASNYQWSNGVFGFYDYQKTTTPVSVLKDGISSMLQSRLDQISSASPYIPIMTFISDTIPMDGIYRNKTYGGAVFHQSTINNILSTEGLSFTFGLRLDYEKTELQYNTYTGSNILYQPQVPPGAPSFSARKDSLINGISSKDYIELLPKFVLKYDIDPQSYVYLSASRGYKTGGHNIQMFAELMQTALVYKIIGTQAAPTDVNKSISFKPEYSWNYEIGGKIDLIKNTLSTNFSVFYIDVKDVQISQFAKTGTGRMTANAGKAVSKGFEVGLKARPCNGFYLYANYGFADAKFKSKEFYMNKHLPFAPRNTFSIGTNISYGLKNSNILDRITFDTNYIGVGKIHWTETNDITQGFYGTVNAKLSFERSIWGLEFWGKNIFDKDYQAFYFKSMGNSFVQKGKPALCGVTLRLKM